MPGDKPKKILKGTARNFRRVKELGDKTQVRLSGALTAIKNNAYDINSLADDLLSQWVDFSEAMFGFSGSEDETPVAYIVTDGGNTPPYQVPLTDMAKANSIRQTMLQGPTITTPAGVTTAYNMAAGDYAIWDPSTEAPPVQNPELESVKIKLTNPPAQLGVYHGALVLPTLKVLARVVVVRI